MTTNPATAPTVPGGRGLRHPRVIRACQIAIGVLFLVAALAKIADLSAFARQLHNFHMVPLGSEHLIAMTLPWIELVAGLALVLGIGARSGAVVVTASLLVFTVVIAVAMARGLDIECGCFGTADASRVGLGKLAQNLGMIALGMVATLRAR